MGILAANLSKPELSLSFFENAVNSNPKIVQYWISLASTLISLGRAEEATRIIQLGKDNGIAEEYFENLIPK